MSDEIAVNRLRLRSFEELDSRAREVWRVVVETRGSGAVKDGVLGGPYNAWLHAPSIGAEAAKLGAAVRFRLNILDRTTAEIAVLVVAHHWQSQFEWSAHASVARDLGVSEDIVASIGMGKVPRFARTKESAIHAVAVELVTTGRLQESTQREAVQHFGDEGLIEAVTLCGYYSLVAFTLNVAGVGAIKGASVPWLEEA